MKTTGKYDILLLRERRNTRENGRFWIVGIIFPIPEKQSCFVRNQYERGEIEVRNQNYVKQDYVRVSELTKAVHEIVTHFDHYRQIAGELSPLPVTMHMERPAPWKKENEIWCMNPGLLKTIWLFDFPAFYVDGNLEEALLRAIFHPDMLPDERIDLSFRKKPVMDTDASAREKYPQLKLGGRSTVIRLKDTDYNYTYWIAVSDSRIAMVEQFWYD